MNDQTSWWDRLLTAGTGVYQTVAGNQAAADLADAQRKQAKATALSSENLLKILPWAIGGVVLLVGAIFLFRKN